MLKSYHSQGIIEAGVDEAGRGCLAGPVVAAAVVLPTGFYHPLLNDSKQVNEKNREMLKGIIEAEAVCYAVAFISPKRIDEINILNASFEAMNHAIKLLNTQPESLLIDGNRFKNSTEIEHHCIIKGDSIYTSIAAASILAKTYRDAYMLKLSKEFPVYFWQKNKGYPTKVHREAIFEHGACFHHRITYSLLK